MERYKNSIVLDHPPDMGIFSQAKVEYVFVYGTLKKGQPRSDYLALCEYSGVDTLMGHLFDLGGYPAYIPDPDGNTVEGEVYKIPSSRYREVMTRLDGLEGLSSLYYRYAFRTLTGKVAWAYWMPRDRIQDTWPVIVDGEWVGQNLNQIQSWIHYIASNRDTYSFPTKMTCMYNENSRCMVCDYFVAGDRGRYYSEAKVTDGDYVIQARIDFPHPIAPRNPTRIVSYSTKAVDIHKEFKQLAAPKKPAPEDSVEVSPMVDLVWLHGKEEPAEKAGPQEVGGI